MTAISNDTVARHSVVLGVGHHRASRVVPNAEVIKAIDSSDEWIQQRSGIIERRWANDDESVQLMAVSAARDALESANIQPGEIDTIIVATVSHMMQTPAVATAVGYELGTGLAAALDISAACAGFCYAMSLGSDLIRAGTSSKVLVIGVERLSDITDRTDRGSAFIFADGAGAAVLGIGDEPGIGPVVWGADGEQYDLIRQREDWRDLIARGSTEMPHLVMQGNAVFRWASYQMAKVALEALDRAGVKAEDLDLFVPHQANMRIIDAMARAMKLPDSVVIARDIAHQGNSSAASIPLALRQMIKDGEAKSGDLALLVAFGAGLAYAAQVVRLP